VCQQRTRLTSYILKLKITTKRSSLESVRQIIRQKLAKVEYEVFPIAIAHGSLPITLSFQSKNGIWANPDTSIHPRSEMYTEEWKLWIWNLL
jgi:hypothetical protein